MKVHHYYFDPNKDASHIDIQAMRDEASNAISKVGHRGGNHWESLIHMHKSHAPCKGVDHEFYLYSDTEVPIALDLLPEEANVTSINHPKKED